MKRFALVFFIIGLVSCNTQNKTKNSSSEPPLLPKTQIISLLTDVQLYESFLVSSRMLRNRNEQSLVLQEIFNKHHLTKEEYDSLQSYLENNLELYKEILDSVKINIENTKEIDLPLLKKIEVPKQHKDSLLDLEDLKKR